MRQQFAVRFKAPSGALACVLMASVAVHPARATEAPPYSEEYTLERSWWTPGEGGILPAISYYKDERGTVAILNSSGPIDTKNHPFFTAQGPNGRACVTCHQPANGMSVSAAKVQERWEATGGKDPLFAPIDGSNCPDLPKDEKKSHSLLLERGLFRFGMPWPPKDIDGKALTPEFSIEVLNDPTECNTSPTYGLHSPTPRISVYRRPRIVANLKYVESPKPLGLWQVRTGEVLPLDAETGLRLAGNLAADSRWPTLNAQLLDAMQGHLEAHELPSKGDRTIVHAFELQLYAAQVSDRDGGSLQAGGAQMGPKALLEGTPAVLGSFPMRPTFPELEGWRTQKTLASMTYPPLFQKLRALPPSRVDEPQESPAQHEFRDSVARGYDLFLYRSFLIRNVGSLNPLLGNPVKQTCAACHNMQESGMDNAPGYLELGTNTYPTATPSPDLPLFKLTCNKDAPPHPYLGRIIYTTDPARALITGKCSDIGAATAQQIRALAARAPYFSNGSARTLREVVEFYDRRFNIGYTERETQDLVNFLGVL